MVAGCAMPASRPAACACWPKTARPSERGRRTRWWPPRSSRVRRQSTCWRLPACRTLHFMSTSTRWTLVVLAVVVTLGVALWMQLDRDGSTGVRGQASARDHRDADTREALAEPRARADLEPCPTDGHGEGPPKLRG